VIYDVEFDGLSPAFGEPKKQILFNSTIKFACQPKSEYVLSCTLGKATTVLSSMHSVGGVLVPRRSKTLKDYQVRKAFEINFDPKDPHIVAHGDIDIYMLDIMRAFIYQFWFSDSANLTKTTTGCFEKPTAGFACSPNCSRIYCVITDKIDKDYVGEGKKVNRTTSDYEIVVGPSRSTLKNEVMHIIMGIDNSTRLPYEYRKMIGVHPGRATTHVTISENTFTAYTDYDVHFRILPSDDLGHERVTVTLDKIVPASDAPPAIPRPRRQNLASQKPFYSENFLYLGVNLYDYWLKMAGDE